MTETTLPKIMQSLVKSWATLILKASKTLDDVPEKYKLGATEYNLRDLVDVEVSKRVIDVMSNKEV